MAGAKSETADPKHLIYQTRETCRTCGGALAEVLDLGVQYLPRFVTDEDRNLPRAPLTLVQCDSCSLLQLKHTVDPDLLYREFWYRSSVNQTMRDALLDVVHTGLKYRYEGGVWLDIGANDGYLLSRVPSSFKKLAVEPALNFKADLEEHADEVFMDYFGPDLKVGPCNIITSVAMFYDLEDPIPFLKGIYNALTEDGVWINQLNDSPTMLKQNAFDSICHEHLMYYDIHNLSRLYEQAGLRIVGLSHNDVNGGSMRVVAMRGREPRESDLLGLPKATSEATSAFRRRILKWKTLMQEHIAQWADHGPLWCYGASTKGTVLLQYLDMNDAFMAVADRNPHKFGRKMVGSWLPITDETAMRKANPKYTMVLPWAFRSEFVERETQVRECGGCLILPLPNIEVVL